MRLDIIKSLSIVFIHVWSRGHHAFVGLIFPSSMPRINTEKRINTGNFSRSPLARASFAHFLPRCNDSITGQALCPKTLAIPSSSKLILDRLMQQSSHETRSPLLFSFTSPIFYFFSFLFFFSSTELLSFIRLIITYILVCASLLYLLFFTPFFNVFSFIILAASFHFCSS